MRRFFQDIIRRVKSHGNFPGIDGAVEDKSDSAGVEVFGKGGRRDGFEERDEFAGLHGYLLIGEII